MIKVAPAGQKDAIEMRKIYAGFVAKQIEAGSGSSPRSGSDELNGDGRRGARLSATCDQLRHYGGQRDRYRGRAVTHRPQAVCSYLYRVCQPSLLRPAVYVPDYQRNNVKVIASDAGVTACHNGGTHMSFEDMGIVRGLAHSVVLEVTDAVMFEDILRQLIDLDGFYWVRTIRKQAPSVYAPGSTFTIGKGNVLREGSDITLIANGIMVAEALEAARQLEQEGVSAAVIDMFTLKPIDRMLVKNYAEKTGRIVTCENHSIHNGLGSAVAEVLVETCPVPMRRVG